MLRPPVKSGSGRAQVNGKTFPNTPIREGHAHAMVLNPPPHKSSQGGGEYQRLKKLLEESTLRRARTNNGAISVAPPNDRESPTYVSQRGQFEVRAPFEIPIRDHFSGRVPWVAFTPAYIRRSYAYQDPAPFKTQNRNVFPGRSPRVASAVTFTRRSYAYLDQGRTNHAQRPIFLDLELSLQTLLVCLHLLRGPQFTQRNLQTRFLGRVS